MTKCNLGKKDSPSSLTDYFSLRTEPRFSHQQHQSLYTGQTKQVAEFKSTRIEINKPFLVPVHSVM